MSTRNGETLLDEQAIIDLTIRYAWAIDHRRFEDLTLVFSADAVADYGRVGTLQGPAAIGHACAHALECFDRTQHIVANHQVSVDGDAGSGRCYFQAQHVRKDAVGDHNYLVAGDYLDRYRRTEDGWRIDHRTLRVTWTDGQPPNRDALDGPGASFVIAGWIEVDPEHVDDLIVAAVEMMHATHEEPGNLEYVFAADPTVRGRIRVFESWRSDADLKGHFETPHMAAFQQALGKAGVRARDLARYHVSAVGPVF